jgi:RES domain-containing protein
VILWRIATETRTYAANDLSGAGAAKDPGRWNAAKEPVIYCAPTLAMAVLETAAHIDDSGLPLNKFVVEIQVPDAVWAQREQVAVAALPATWNAIPAGGGSAKFGSDWLASLRTPLLVLPSVIVPEETIVLINPRHRAGTDITARTLRRFEYNQLFRGGA